jgi:hypothetical protein
MHSLSKRLQKIIKLRHSKTDLQTRSRFSVALSLMIFFSHTQAHAQTQAQAQEPSLGRLFSTPAERANLDRLRLQNKLGEVATETLTTPATEIPPQEFTHNGFVKRSNGMETTWINQQVNLSQKNSPNIKVRQQLSKAPTVTVLLPSGKRQELKVGQSFDATTGKIREVYEAAPPRPLKKTEDKP